MSSDPDHESTVYAGASQNVQVACAADDNYAMPLGVTLASAAKNLGSGEKLEVFLLDGNISNANRAKLLETTQQFGIEINWIKADFSLLDELSVSHHISHVAYYRLLLSRILPKELDRILYLDSDLLVRGNIAEIWKLPLESSLLAIPDVACPFVDARHVEESRAARPYLAVLSPIPNYGQLGIAPTENYFNSGVLMIDLQRWREEKLCQQFVDCLRENQKFVWCWDQYALNVVMANNWTPISPTWNQGAHVFEFPTEEQAPFPLDQFVEMRDDPKIVHFTTEWKPWHYANRHPFRNQFFEMLDETAWSGWRPTRPSFKIKRWWQNRAVSIQKRAVITYRKIANAWL